MANLDPTLNQPLWKSLRHGLPPYWRDDLLAGVLTAVMLVPQALAYAMLAGLPAHMGLYASILPLALYALLGSSRSLSVGPVAVAALMVASALAGHAQGEPQRWIDGAVILSFECGVILLLMRGLGLDQLSRFISHPVLSGFTSAAAVLIIISQLPQLLGLPDRAGPWLQFVQEMLQQEKPLHALTLLLGLVCVALLLLARSPLRLLLNHLDVTPGTARLLSRVSPLLLVAGGSLLAAQAGWSDQGLAVVGSIPAGLPLPSLQLFQAQGWLSLAPQAGLIALVSFIESLSVARALAAKTGEKIDSQRELSALGVANLASASCGGMPVAGGFSRSIVNHEAGARSQLASLITAALIGIIVLFLGHWFEHLPLAVLAAIIVVAVAQLIDLKTLRQVFAYDHNEGLALLLTFAGVLVMGIEAGLLLGIVLSLAQYLKRSSEPHMAVLGRVPGTEHFRNVQRHQVLCEETTLLLRVDENLYFANIDAVDRFLRTQLRQQPDIKFLLLNMAAVNLIDATAQDWLDHLERELEHQGITLHLAEVKGPVMDHLRCSELGQRLIQAPTPRIHLSTHQAMCAISPSAPQT